MGILELISKYRPALLDGLGVTLQLCGLVWLAGLVLGVPLGALGSRFHNSVGVPIRAFAFVLAAVPILVVLLWFHYPLQRLLRIVVDPFVTAAVTLGLVNTLAVADAVRSVLDDFPHQYVVAGRVCGLTRRDVLLHVQVPIVLRQLLPVLLSLQVAMLQASLFASMISVDEVFRVAQRINALEYRPVEIYTGLALLFLLVCLPLNALAGHLKSRYTRNLSEN